MSTTETPVERMKLEPMPENIRSVQPGGGVCYQIELAWGRWRRWLLKHFWSGYVARMAALRQGSTDGAPHEILDPRDLKYCCNQCTCHWRPEDDPFAWRERLPFARWGLAELQLIGWPLLALTLVVGYFFWYLAWIPAVPLGWVVWFFRDPPRQIPREPGLLVSPADGRVVSVDRLEHDEFVGGPVVRIGIFLSIFNVHLNRMPCDCRVIELRYEKGDFVSATRPESALRNENIWIGIEEAQVPYRRMVVRPIAGAVARRIVCPLRPGDELKRGEKIGMIKLGSRTELIVPETPDLRVDVAVGRRVKAGRTVVARYDIDGQEPGTPS
ncbi:MAG: phosphatidylserine decarboxylase family protein [Pirellulales bacterium]|nr:phosphatidylserine decarboxylase family protein [Pirellulales bacterium]